LLVRAHRGRFQNPFQGFLRFWRDARVAEGARLEIVCTARYRGFESLSLLSGARIESRGAGPLSASRVSPIPEVHGL
jgi:hypothetical protein